MIDIHSHFLPGIDDGAQNVSESIEMLVDDKEQGVEICVGTPHLFIHSPQAIEDFLRKRQASFEVLHDYLEMNQKEPSVPKLLLGAEVYLNCDVSRYEDVEKLCITGTRYILVELSYDVYESKYAEWLYNLSIKGITPILAHIERYSYLDKLLDDISDLDVVLQMNAEPLCGILAGHILSKAVKSGKKVIVSSDMHNMVKRRSFMKKAFKKLHKKDKRLADNMFHGYAAEVLGLQ